MRAQLLTAPRTPACRGELPRAAARAGAGPDRGAGLRGLPHRSACRRRRAAAPEAAARPGPRDRRHVVETGEGADRVRARRPGRRAVARLDLRRLRAIAAAGRENLCDRARFTGYQIDGGYAELTVADAALLLCRFRPASATSQAAPLLCAGLIGYRALRMAGDGGAARHLRLRRRRAHRRPGRAPSGPAGLRLHAARRCRGAGLRARARRGLGRRLATRRRPNRSTRRSSSRRSARWCRRRCAAVAQGRHGRLRRHPHERHPDLSLRAPLGGARRPLGRQPDPPRRRGISRPRAGRRDHDDDADLSARRRQPRARRSAQRRLAGRRGAGACGQSLRRRALPVSRAGSAALSREDCPEAVPAGCRDRLLFLRFVGDALADPGPRLVALLVLPMIAVSADSPAPVWPALRRRCRRRGVAGIARDGAAATTKPPAAKKNVMTAHRTACRATRVLQRGKFDKPLDRHFIADPQRSV